MKTIKLLIAIIAISAGAARAQFIGAELQVSGLTCSMCSKATEKSLRSLSFISDIKADLNRNVFVLTFNNEPVNLSQISQKVQKAGFSVNNLKATFNFAAVKLDGNAFSFSGDTFYLMNAPEKNLVGKQTFTVLDKGFVPASVGKKYGLTESKPGRVYHVVI